MSSQVTPAAISPEQLKNLILEIHRPVVTLSRALFVQWPPGKIALMPHWNFPSFTITFSIGMGQVCHP